MTIIRSGDELRFTVQVALLVLVTFPIVACDGSKQQIDAKPRSEEASPSKESQSSFTVRINSSPHFESQGGWSAGYTRATGHGPGVIVGPGADNPNVFAQPFRAEANQSFEVIARASTAGKPGARGRIQVNWTDPAGKFISVSSKAFDVASAEQTVELEVVAPPGTATGTLYVVPDGSDSVVRYTEMSLLAKGKAGTEASQTSSAKAPANLARVGQSSFSIRVNSSPLFDSQQGWSAGYARAIGHGPGVVVGPGSDNPNIFTQQFPAKEKEAFRVVARASSADKPEAMGRIQINWTDSAGKFISVSSKAFQVKSVEQTFELDAVAPARTANGILYVVPDGPESVVRYTEMTLLTNEKAGIEASQPSGPRAPAVPRESHGSEMAPRTAAADPFPRPSTLTPLDGSGRALTVAESQYYFYHTTKAMQQKARERGMDFIMFVMPDYHIARLLPAIKQLRAEGVKVLAYEPADPWTSGVDAEWYWQHADSHWREGAVRLTADEILNMWKTQSVANRPFSQTLMGDYANGFPKQK